MGLAFFLLSQAKATANYNSEPGLVWLPFSLCKYTKFRLLLQKGDPS